MEASTTKLRLAEAAQRGRVLLDQGALGRVTGFNARFGTPPTAPLDQGVMAGAGAALLDLISALLGPVAVVRYADDARGGWEAEAEVTLAAGDVTGEVVLSRLRTLENTLTLTGETGVLQGQSVVFNLAHDFRRDGNANLRAFNHLVGAGVSAKVDRFVHVSSIAVYDAWPGPDLDEDAPARAPGSEYKSAKLAMEAELAARSADGALPAVVVQPTLVYGPFSLLWTDLPARWLAEGEVVLPEPAGLANAVYVDDVVQGLIRAATAEGAAGQRFILSGPEPRPWRELFEGYAHALGRPEAIKFMPPPENAGASHAPTGLAALLKDPMRLADWKPARQALNAIQNALGEAAVARLRGLVLGLKRRSGGPVVHYPSPDDMTLYLARGTCRIDRARAGLGYDPRFDLQAGLARVAAYLAWRRAGVDS